MDVSWEGRAASLLCGKKGRKRRNRNGSNIAPVSLFTSDPVGRSESTDDIRPCKILEILTHGDQTSMVIKFIGATEFKMEIISDL